MALLNSQVIPPRSTHIRPFKYLQIDPATETRTLEISSPDLNNLFISSSEARLGSWQTNPSRLRGSFVVATLADNPKYEALSYVWGEQVLDDEIQLPEGILPITSHLGSGLRHLRHKLGSRRLWVDALCIDQRPDAKEKGLKVSRMEDIYPKTVGVLVWLESSSVLTAEAIDTLT